MKSSIAYIHSVDHVNALSVWLFVLSMLAIIVWDIRRQIRQENATHRALAVPSKYTTK